MHLGKHGVYYRQRIGGPGDTSEARTGDSPDESSSKPFDASGIRDLREFTADEAVSDINRKIQQRGKAVLVGSLVAAVGCVSLLVGIVNPHDAAAAVWLCLGALVIAAGITSGTRLAKQEAKARVTELHYRLEPDADARFKLMSGSLLSLSRSHRLWLVSSSHTTTNWKLHGGATSLVKRQEVSAGLMTPPYIKTSLEVCGIDTGHLKLFFLPDHMLVYSGQRYGALSYPSLQVSVRAARFIESESCPADATHCGSTWLHANKSGGPDRRFASNRQLPIVLYGELILSAGRLTLQLQVSNLDLANAFARAFSPASASAGGSSSQKRPSDPSAGYRIPAAKPQPTGPSPQDILGVSRDATTDQIVTAYHEKAKMYHPDKVASLGPELRELAEAKMKQINAAFLALKKGAASDVPGPVPKADNRSEGNVRQPNPEPGGPDELFDFTLDLITDMGRASTSVLQRRLSIGYGKAAKILDSMERAGFIGPADGAKPRKVLLAAYEYRNRRKWSGGPGPRR